MVLRSIMLCATAAVLACCGGDPAPAAPGACEPKDGAPPFASVDLQVESPLPDGLTQACSGNPADLDAILLGATATGGCALNVDTTGVSGCCPNVAINQVAQLTLVYRRSGPTPLAEQTKAVTLDDTGPSVVTVSFAGATLDAPYDSNGNSIKDLIEWCSGSL